MKEQLAKLGGKIELQSSYFLLKGFGTVGDSKINLNSLIYASTDGNNIDVVSRAIGTDGI